MSLCFPELDVDVDIESPQHQLACAGQAAEAEASSIPFAIEDHGCLNEFHLLNDSFVCKFRDRHRISEVQEIRCLSPNYGLPSNEKGAQKTGCSHCFLTAIIAFRSATTFERPARHSR